MPILRVEQLTKNYRSGGETQCVINNLSFAINSGERVALIGESGAGKSTLLNLISGIDNPDKGAIYYRDQRLNGLSDGQRSRWRRHNLGFVFQFFNLIPTLTVEENLLLPLELTAKVSRPEQERAHQLLQAVGLGAYARRFPEQLSGGEQQRLAIARALIHRPLLLLADEPTGNLDPRTGERVLELLLGLVTERQMTLLMVTHSHLVAQRADRILRLSGGQIEEVSR